MAETVYLLCAATSMLCAALLFRGYRRSQSRLLLWSALCFAGLAANNALLVVDRLIATDVDLSTWRLVPAVLGMGALVFGLIWERE
jgi:hypothetical protein